VTKSTEPLHYHIEIPLLAILFGYFRVYCFFPSYRSLRRERAA
jgi:hypothetical protein